MLAVIRLATDLDQESRESSYSLVPLSWWAERTAGLAGGEQVADETEHPNDEFPGR